MKLRIVDDIVAMVGRMYKVAGVIARHDKDLAQQLRTASASVALNSGEGLYARGGNHRARLETAMCSGREVVMALRIAGAAGFLGGEVALTEANDVDRIVATLYKLTYRR